jgi:hypothetical protein
MTYFRRAPLPGEFIVNSRRFSGQHKIEYKKQRREYPGPTKVNYTAEAWERHVNGWVGYVRGWDKNTIDARLFREFVLFLSDEYERGVSRLRQMEEDGKIDSADEWIEPFVQPKGVCWWGVDGWVLVDMNDCEVCDGSGYVQEGASDCACECCDGIGVVASEAREV